MLVVGLGCERNQISELLASQDLQRGPKLVAFNMQDTGGTKATIAAGVAAIVGHIYPVWLRFRGGKGVATACGVFSVLTPLAVPPVAMIFLATVWATKYISLGSVVASVALPPVAYATGSPPAVLGAALAAAMLVVFRHRSNLMRVRSGTERRIGARV